MRMKQSHVPKEGASPHTYGAVIFCTMFRHRMIHTRHQGTPLETGLARPFTTLCKRSSLVYIFGGSLFSIDRGYNMTTPVDRTESAGRSTSVCLSIDIRCIRALPAFSLTKPAILVINSTRNKEILICEMKRAEVFLPHV